LNYFFDTSALAKIYHKEEESERVIAIFNSHDSRQSFAVEELKGKNFFSTDY